MDMRYMGYNIIAFPKKDLIRVHDKENKAVHTDGFLCHIYYSKHVSYEELMAVVELAVGFEIKDKSEDEVRRAVFNYIDEHKNELAREEARFEKNRLKLLLRYALDALDGYECGQHLYGLLHTNLEMNDVELVRAGFIELVPYFDRKKYAKEIAKYLTDYGTMHSFSGAWFFKYSNISRKFGVSLPFDSEMLDLIKGSFDPEIVTDMDMTDGIYLTFNPIFCPEIRKEAENDD